MIYETIDALCGEELVLMQRAVQHSEEEIERLQEAIKVEDSKKREATLREELGDMRRSQRNLWGAIASIREKAFKKSLAEEYGVVGNPKFEQCYSIAYSYGHSCGFSDVENYFSTIVELIR